MSYGWTGSFRAGAWRAFRLHVLRARADVPARLAAIEAELLRIGAVRVVYGPRDPGNPSGPRSERRVGLDVTPGTVLERLLQAYIARGGNPLDISMFLAPDSDVDGSETQPYGGLVAPQSADPGAAGTYQGGWIPLWRYPPRRLGNNRSYDDEVVEVSRAIHAAREWIRQDIESLNDLEARILKQADLREQLQRERDEILPMAVGGSALGLSFDASLYARSFHVCNIVSTFDGVFYTLDVTGAPRVWDRPRVSGPNPPYPTLMDDAPQDEEAWTAIG